MDTSQEYVKMCEKAGEIQIIFNTINPEMPHIVVTDRDFIWCPKHKDFWTVRRDGYLCATRYPGEPCNENGIWLPRQDQLQKMLLEPKNTKYDSPFHLLQYFVVFVAVHPELDTMEKLWLAFVMHEKYGRVFGDCFPWYGQDWVKER